MLLTGIVAEYGVGCCWSYCRLIGPLRSSTADPLGGVLEVGLKQYVVHICGRLCIIITGLVMNQRT